MTLSPRVGPWAGPLWLAVTIGLLTAVNPNWLVPVTPHWGWVDQWLYLGAMFFPDYLVKTAPSNYYSARISWTAPGHLLHALLPDPVAFVVFHLAAWFGFSILVYLSARRLFGRRTALFAALLLGLYAHIVWLLASPMTYAGSFTYLLAALGVVSRVRESGRLSPWRSAAFGACVALALLAHVLVAVLLPLALVWYVCNRPSGRWMPGAADIAAGLAGGAAVAIAAGLYFIGIGADFWYAWRVNWSTIITLRDSGYEPGLHAALTWPLPEHLLWPAVVACLSALVVARAISQRRWARLVHPRRDLPVVLYLAACAIYVGWQLAGSVTAQIPEYFSQVFPFMALALARLLWPVVGRIPLRPYWTTLLLATVILLIPFHPSFPWRPESHLTAAERAPLLWGFGLLALIGALLLLRRRRALLWMPCVILIFSVGNITSRHEMMFPHQATRDSFVATLAAARELEPAFRQSVPGETALWYSRRDAAAAVFGGLQYMFYSTPPVGCEAPMLGTGCGTQTAPATLPRRLFLLSSRESSEPEVKALAAAGHQVREERQRHMLHGSVNFWLHDLANLSATPLDRPPDLHALVSVPGSTVVAWNDLKDVVQQAGYSDSPASLLSTGAPLVFTPRTPRDHVATPFVPLRPVTEWRALDLVLTTGLLSDARCTANLQDDRYQLIGQVACSRIMRQASVSFPVSPAVTRVRVFFEGTDLQPQRLPDTIELVDHAR